MMKKCFKCGSEKALTDFYKHPKMKDGRLGKCKDCTKADVRANRKERAEYYKIYDAQRYQNDPKVKARHERYQKTEGGKKAFARAREKWLAKNQDKRAAHIIVGNAVKRGRLIKPDFCTVCFATGCRIEGHHEDYAKPLDVQWLCRSCHVNAHRRTK